MSLNPIVFTKQILDTFLRYQRTAFPFSDPRLAAQAKEMGLVNRVVPRERLEDEVDELAFHVAQAPLTTLMAAKANIRRAWDLMGIRTHLQASNDLLTLATQATDVREYMKSVFAAGLRPRDAARRNAERAREIIEFVTLGRLAGNPASTLSGGQRKLLELARVLMAAPQLVLLDEPGAGVNPTLLETIIDRIRTLNARGITFLVVEHNMDMIARLCSRVHVMVAGRMLASGPPAEVIRDARVVQAYLGGTA